MLNVFTGKELNSFRVLLVLIIYVLNSILPAYSATSFTLTLMVLCSFIQVFTTRSCYTLLVNIYVYIDVVHHDINSIHMCDVILCYIYVATHILLMSC